MIFSIMSDLTKFINSIPTLEVAPNTKHRFICERKTIFPEEVLQVEEGKLILKEFNRKNRPLSPTHLERLCHDIVAGNFNYDTGDSVRFDTEGDLLDVQHRIAAHVLVNKPFPTIVVAGIPSKAILHIDGGLPRQYGTVSLMVDRLNDGNATTSIAQESLTRRNQEIQIVKAWFKHGTRNRVFTKHDVEQFRKEKYDVISKVLRKVENDRTRLVGYRTAVAMYFEKDPIKAEAFFQAVGGDGALLPPGSPILKLRKFLEDTKTGGGNAIKKSYVVTVSMIHAFHEGRTVRNVSEKEEWDF